MQFSAPLIDQLLASENIPVWGSNRPSVLVWMALQDATGSRSMLNSESGAEIIDFMRRFGEERGLPIIFPLLDIEDRRNLPADAIWTQDDRHQAASNATIPDSIRAAGCCSRHGRTAWPVAVHSWNEADGTRRLDTDLESYLEQTCPHTSQLSGYFALVPAGKANSSVRLRSTASAIFSTIRAVESFAESAWCRRRICVLWTGERLDLQSTCEAVRTSVQLIAHRRDLLAGEQRRKTPARPCCIIAV